MSFEFYKLVHITGMLMLFCGLAGLVGMKLNGVELNPRGRRLFFLFHGLGLLALIVAGFGMLARMGLMGQLPNWVYAKLAIWLVLGGGVALAKRRGQVGGPLLILFVGLGLTAGWLAIMKPF